MQCGAIIGKGGSNIKNLMQTTGASVHVASDMLPESTERLVTLTGTPEAVTRCIHEICTILMTVRKSKIVTIHTYTYVYSNVWQCLQKYRG